MRGKTNALIGGGGGGSTPTEEKIVQATEFPTIVEPRSGYALSKATVTAPDNLSAENIRKDVSIAGVTGTYGGIDMPDDWVGASYSVSYYNNISHTVDFQSYSGKETISFKSLRSPTTVYSPSIGKLIVAPSSNTNTVSTSNRISAIAPEHDVTIPSNYLGINYISFGKKDSTSKGEIFLFKGAVYRELAPGAYNTDNGAPQLGGEYTCELTLYSKNISDYSEMSYFNVSNMSTNDFHFDEHEFIAGHYSSWSTAYINYRITPISLERIS